MNRLTAFPLLLFIAAGCGEEDPTLPNGGPEPPEPPTASVTLCAMSSVVDQIRGILEEPNHDAGDIVVPHSEEACGCSHEYPGHCPRGTLTYSTAGPTFEWEFEGSNFYPERREYIGSAYRLWRHCYVLVYYRDPWPGRGMRCLEGNETCRSADATGSIRFAGSMELNADLPPGKIWIVRRGWVDCDGTGFPLRDNPDDVSQARLTNDADGNGIADATDSCAEPFGPDDLWPCSEDHSPAYDWLFETELVQYDDTDVN